MMGRTHTRSKKVNIMPVEHGAKPHIPYMNKFKTLDLFLTFVAKEIYSGRVWGQEQDEVCRELARAADLVYKGLKKSTARTESHFREYTPVSAPTIAGWSKYIYHRNGHVVYGVKPDGEKVRLYSWDLDVLTRQVKAGLLKEVYHG